METTLRPSMSFEYAFGDYDAGDRYTMRVEEVGASLRYTWRLEGKWGDHGVVRVSAASLEAPAGLMWFSQGAVIAGLEEVPVRDPDQPVDTDGYLAPFWPSSAWNAPGPVDLAVNYTSHKLERTDETERTSVQLAGKPTEVQGRVWRSPDQQSSVLVSQDERAPGLLRVSLDGGYIECHLRAIS